MEERSGILESLFEKTKNYIDSALELMKLKAADKLSELLSSLISKVVILVLFTFVFIFINIALSLWIGEMLGKSYWGFFVVSGFYLLILLLFSAFGKRALKNSISNYLLNTLLS